MAENPEAPPSTPSQAPYWVAVAVLVGAGILLLLWAGLGRLSGGDPSVPSGGSVPSAAGDREACPDFTLERADGSQSVTRESLGGAVTVLHFWATWCPPCRREFPEFARYAQGAEGDGLRILAVSLDDEPATAVAWANENGRGLPVWAGGQELAGALGIDGIPSTVLLDREGRVAQVAVGAQSWSEGGLPGRIEALRRE